MSRPGEDRDKSFEDTDPNIQQTSATRVVMITQQAIEDVEGGLGGPLTPAARAMLVHHLGQTFDLGREHEREKTIEERRAREKSEREAESTALDAELALKERDRKIESLERQLARLRSRATKR